MDGDRSKKTEAIFKRKPIREVWSHSLDFLFSCLSYAVGFGNIWRFPYLCYKNGGGAFLIPYLLCVFIGGFPMLFLEISLGQYTSQGGIQAWQICPLMKGIGAATTVIITLGHVYYVIILAWASFYLFSSFTFVLPWSHCNNTWNSLMCKDTPELLNATMLNLTHSLEVHGDNMVNYPISDQETFNFSDINGTEDIKYKDSAVEFWENRVLSLSEGIDHPGVLKWDLSLCLFLCWVLTFLCMLGGIKTAGKVMYVTFIFPYVMLVVLLVRGVTLPGAAEGLKYYMIPRWSRLADSLVWADAGMQVFFSYAVGAGVNVALGSYNKFNHNSLRDAAIVSFGNSFTSFFAGFAIFSVLGFMAHEQGVSVENVVESGPGLSFIVYPKALAQMPFAPCWSVLFFTMLFMLGFGSHLGGVETTVAALLDQFPNQLRRRHMRTLVTFVVSSLMFALGLTMVTDGGMYVFQIFDYFSCSNTVMLVGFFQCITISYLYGINKYYNNIKEMLGYTLNPFMKFAWAIAAPIYTLVIFTFSIYNYTEVTYNGVYKYPNWAVACGWIMTSSSIVMIPLFAIIGILKTPGNIKQRIRILLDADYEKGKMKDVNMGLKEANEKHTFFDT